METQEPKVEEVQGQGHGTRKKRKDIEIDKVKVVPHPKKHKEDKETSPLSLMEDDFERFGDKVKEITKNLFQHMVE
jgi:hypothetical protein